MNTYFQFAEPWFLLLLAIPLIFVLFPPRSGGAAFGAFHILQQVAKPSRAPLVYRILMACGTSLLIVALARPQYGTEIVEYNSEGRDLMLVIDLSASMRLDDMSNEADKRITRLEAVFHAADQFIAGRPNDRMGLVFFSEQALVSCPLTRDHGTLHDMLQRTRAIQEDLWERRSNLLGRGTNIGLGLGYAIKTLEQRNSEEQAQILGSAIILITDGRDSQGHKEPMIAAKHARNADIRIHSIGVGDPNGTFTERDPFGRTQISRIGQRELPDMNLLRKIAKETKAVAMRAGDKDELASVFKKIDELEPSPREEKRRDNFTDRFFLPLLIGLICCALGFILEPRLRGALA